MYSFDAAAYKGVNHKDEHVGYISTDAFFCVASGKGEMSLEQLDVLLNNVKYRVTSERIAHLKDLEQLIEEELNQVSAQDVSLAVSFSIDNIIYLVTRGKGCVYIFRGGSLQKLVDSNNVASGQLQHADTFILTTEQFFSEVDESHLTIILSDNALEKLVELLESELKKTKEVPLIAYFIRAHKQSAPSIVENYAARGAEHGVGAGHEAGQGVKHEIRAEHEDENRTGYADDGFSDVESFAPRTSGHHNKPRFPLHLPAQLLSLKFPNIRSSSRGKKITLVITVVLFIVFTWSVILGNSRREKSKFIEEVKQTDQTVNEKLAEAEDVRIEDPVKALQLVDEATSLYAILNKEAVDKKYADVSELKTIAQNIETAKQGIQKAEQSPSEEFYDLSLIKSGATAQKMYLSENDLALLDSINGRVYTLTVDDKSVDTVSGKDVRDAQYVGLHQGNVLVFKQNFGVIKFTDDKAEKVISADKVWKNVKDIGLYNGNIYLLVEGNNEVYKYLVAENGYGEKNSYFKTGQTENLSGAQAMAIDSAVYIVKDTKVAKYVSGLHAAFGLKIPDENAVFNDIYTSASLENVYVMDKKHGTIYIFDKDGAFQKQVTSSVIAKADDFVVDQEVGIIVLAKNKIYKIKQNN